MGKGKKKGGPGKGITKEVEDLESLTISDAPSTSEVMQTEEEEEGLTGAAKRRKKKELKKAEKEAKKGDSEVKDVVLEEMPAAASTTAAEPSPAPSTVQEPSKPKEAPKQEEEGGLGLEMGSRKKHPRKKKADAAKAAAPQGQPRTDVTPVTEVPSTSWAQPAPVAAPKSPWGKDQTSAQQPTPMELDSPAKSAPTKWSQFPVSVGQTRSTTSPATETPVPSSSRTSTTSSKIELLPAERERERSHYGRTPVTCRFKIPKKIEGNSVPTMPVKVLTNYLPMTIKQLKIYRYDISFKPDRPKKMLGKVFTLSKEKHFPQNLTAFDQIKNCYSLTELKGVTAAERYVTHVDITDQNGRVINFEVSYKATGCVDLGSITNYMNTGGTSLSPPTEAIQCIDVILRQGTLESYVKAGRQFFKRPANPIDLGDGLEMWTGLFQSGIFTSRAFINIDVAHKGFPRQQPLVNALADFRLDPRKALDFQRGRGLENFQNYIKGLRVVAAIGGDSSSKGMKREFICNGYVGPADKETFCYETPEGKKQQITVTQYFLQVKNVRLKYPSLNCIWVGPREKTIFYPMELLEVGYGQAQNKQLNETQLATMVRQAATPPDERKRKIEEVIENMNYSRNQYFKKFGLEISDKFFQVDAKILKAPVLEVGEQQTAMPRRGVWQANRVYKPETLQSWGFIAVEADPNRCDFENTIKMIQKVGRSMGMVVTEPIVKKFDVNIRSLQSVLFTALEKNVKFLFVVVSAKGRDYYHKVKQMAERDVGILTQCIKEYTAASRMNIQTVKNILLKVNAKLMGINQVLSQSCLPRCLQSGGVMVVGADVTHPSPDQSNIPSIAAVTASIDTKFFLYNIELSIQTPKKEMIVEFEDMMVEHLKVYRNHQKSLPRKIFVFRDGVSEGQFAHVMNSELQAVHNAYKTLGGPQARPEVMFLLVQKRHHTRLFVPNSPQNVEPGTVVDKHIVHASELDFYLVSHQAIKGTARPTRYHAVCNDGGIPHDEVEQLTYYLCHLYARCMRAVSYPTPTYYAHLACLRARSLTYGEKFDNKELERHPKRLRVMEKILQYSRMFFV